MSMPAPIPLNSYAGEQPNMSGTGFLVSRGTDTWLITCPHMVTGTDKAPVDIAPFFGASLGCLGTDIRIPLVSGATQRFNCVKLDPSNVMADIISIKLSYSE